MSRSLVLARLLLAALLGWLTLAPPASAAPITYTGQLLSGTAPVANGAYDFKFSLFTAATGGTQVGSTLSVSAVTVADGVFYVQLDFGSVVNGQTLYLQTAYRPHPSPGGTSYTTQTPRNLVPTSPYADYAAVSGSTNALQGKGISATAPTSGQVLTWNGSLWTPTTVSGGGGGTYTAGNGLTLSGSQFSVAVPLLLYGDGGGSPIVSASNTGSGDGVDGSSANGYGIYGKNTANGDYGFLGGTDPKFGAAVGVFGSDTTSPGTNGVFGLSVGGSGVAGVSTSGFGVYASSASDDGMQGQTTDKGHSGVSGVNTSSGDGVLGVSRSSGDYGFLGGTDPTYNAPAGVFGSDGSSSGGNGVLGISSKGSGLCGVSTSGRGVYGVSTSSTGVYAQSSTGYGVFATVSSASGQAVLAQNSSNKTNASLCDQYGDGVYASAPSGHSAIRCDGSVSINGSASVHVLQITGGSDVAEPYTVSAAEGVSAIPGLVVSIDPAHPGQMSVSQRAYDHAVAGILSGGGGVQPGLTLRQTGTVADGTLPVACSGRVWCFCDADAGGAIAPGDLLTTSNTPGHAMKAGDGHELRGAILGKAMSSLKSGKGLVLVLVTLE